MWLGVDLRIGTNKTCVWKRLRAKNVLIILGSIIDMIGEPLWALNEHKNLHFDND